jgi:uncharacterized protein YbjT (DUF2867 family)
MPSAPWRACLLLIGIIAAGNALAGNGDTRILVAGATGGTGQAVVSQALAEGYAVRALVRDEAVARRVLGDDVELVVAQLDDSASLRRALAAVDVVISALGAKAPDGPGRPEKVDYEGVRNLAVAASVAGIRQFVLVSSRGVTGPESDFSKSFGNILRWKREGEKAVATSGVPYTIIRPGGLTDEPAGLGAISIEQGDRPLVSTTIARADVARVCLEALRHPGAKDQSFELLRTKGGVQQEWAALFAGLPASGEPGAPARP